MKLQRPTLWLASLLLAWAFATPASHAYVYWTCEGEKIVWDSDELTMRGGSGTFPPGNPFRAALSSMIGRINQNPSNFRFDVSFGDDSVGKGNDQNEVWGTFDPDLLEGFPALSAMWLICKSNGDSKWTEADVLYDADVSWTPGTNKTDYTSYGGGKRPFGTTTQHELGHSTGLYHSNVQYQIMGSDTTHVHANGPMARPYLGENAADGLVFLYGTASGNVEDVSVVHWKYAGASGEYSTHQRTVMTRFSGAPLATVGDPVDGTRYRVNKGQIVQVEFTYENNGKSFQEPSVAFYLSGNDTISTGDLQIGTATLALARNSVYTTTVFVQIPVFVPSGNLYLGAIIDWNNQISEFTAANNATYIPIRVNPGPVM